MVDKHDEQIPLAIDTVVTRLGDLEVVLGPQTVPVIAAVRSMLIRAMAARDRGDLPATMREISEAMDRLTTLADQLDPAEAIMMRAIAQSFRDALMRGDEGQAKQEAARMFEKSGAAERKKD